MKTVERIDGKDSFSKAQHFARYGHRDWIWWVDKRGKSHAARKTPENVKAMLLATGTTKGTWTLITANDGCPMVGFWAMGINIMAQMKRGWR